MRRIALVAWFLLVTVVAGVLGNSSVKAQWQGCDPGCRCDCQTGNQGLYMWHMCAYPCEYCPYWGGYDTCETDYCGVTCPSGYIAYCVSWAYCGNPQTTGCWNMYCG